jgi:hypothetical protein
MADVIPILSTDVGDFPCPQEMVEAAKAVKWRKHDRSWPDMRTKVGKQWVKMFKTFSDQKLNEYMANL